jgi:hypothetical protein
MGQKIISKESRHHAGENSRRAACSLRINVNSYTGLEFHRKLVRVDGDFLNQPLDQSLVKFSEFGRLSGDEFLQLADAA